MSFSRYPLFSLVGLVALEEKGADGDNEQSIHDDEDSEVLEICANEVGMYNDKEEN